jgi:hypothetical protein
MLEQGWENATRDPLGGSHTEETSCIKLFNVISLPNNFLLINTLEKLGVIAVVKMIMLL